MVTGSLDEVNEELVRMAGAAHERRVATATAMLLDRLGEVVGQVDWLDEAAARRLVADILEAST